MFFHFKMCWCYLHSDIIVLQVASIKNTVLTLHTEVDSVVGHHVLVVVETQLKVLLLLLVTEKPLWSHKIHLILSLNDKKKRTTRLSYNVHWFTYHLQGTVVKLHTQSLEGGHKVKGEGVSFLPEAYEQADLDSSEHNSFSDQLIDRRPIPADSF